MCFFNRGGTEGTHDDDDMMMIMVMTEGTNSSKMLCPMFVYVLFYANLCQD